MENYITGWNTQYCEDGVRWEGSSRYVNLRLIHIHMYGRNQHNIVKQVSSN